MIKKYRKKPVVIEAMQFKRVGDGTNAHEILDWANGGEDFKVLRDHFASLDVYTSHGKAICLLDQYIIKNDTGEFYPCTKNIFEATYEEVDG